MAIGTGSYFFNDIEAPKDMTFDVSCIGLWHGIKPKKLISNQILYLYFINAHIQNTFTRFTSFIFRIILMQKK